MIPHDAAFSNQTIPPQRDYNSMSGTSAPQVSTYNCPARDDSFTAKDDILGTGDGGASGYLVSSVLGCHILVFVRKEIEDSYSFDEFGF